MQEKTLKKVWYGSIVLYIGTLAFVAVLTPCIVPLILSCVIGMWYMKFIFCPMFLPILPACGEEHWTLIVFMALIKRSIFPADG